MSAPLLTRGWGRTEPHVRTQLQAPLLLASPPPALPLRLPHRCSRGCPGAAPARQGEAGTLAGCTTLGSPRLPTTVAPKRSGRFSRAAGWVPRAGPRLLLTAALPRPTAAGSHGQRRGQAAACRAGCECRALFFISSFEKIRANLSFLSIDFPVKAALCPPLIPTLQENKPYKRNGYPCCLRD